MSSVVEESSGGGGGIRTHGGVAPTHAFEACSFGRSDTPPWATLLEALRGREIRLPGRSAARGEEVQQQGRTAGLVHAADNFDPVQREGIAAQVPYRAARPCFRVPGAEHDAVDP